MTRVLSRAANQDEAVRVLLVRCAESLGIEKASGRLAERDAVLTKVRPSLGLVPFEIAETEGRHATPPRRRGRAVIASSLCVIDLIVSRTCDCLLFLALRCFRPSGRADSRSASTSGRTSSYEQ